MAKIIENGPDKVVIVAGPTFGEALRFMAFGFALGAGAVYFLLAKDRNPSVAASEAATPSAIDRALDLAHRAKEVAERAKEVIHSVQEAAAPVVHRAVEQGKQVAAEVESRLRHEIDEASEKDPEEPPSQTEEKFVE